MAHFAKLDENNIVICVLAGRDEDDENELTARTGDTYRQTSYNTHGGIHYNSETGEPSENQSKAYRKNYAGIGYSYDEDRDAFIPPKPYESWMLNESTCIWESPSPYPDDNKHYIWDEEQQGWVRPAYGN